MNGISIVVKLRVSNKLIWSRRVWDRVLSSILALAILGALGTLAYILATPRLGERFTEFYLLDLNGEEHIEIDWEDDGMDEIQIFELDPDDAEEEYIEPDSTNSGGG